MSTEERENVGQSEGPSLASGYSKKKLQYIERLKSIGERNREEILECVARNEPDGRTTGQLTKETGVHRDTVYTLCKQLEDEGWIKKTGKFGKYHLTEYALGDAAIGSWIFSGEVMRQFRKWNVPPSRPNKFCNITADNKEIDEKEIFDFSNRVGALIAYILLQALRPREITVKRSRNNNTKKFKISGYQKTEQARSWVQKTISPFRILFEFCELSTIANGLAIWSDIPINKSLPLEVQEKVREIQSKRRKFNPSDPLWTPYEMDEHNFRKVSRAFANVYPEVYKELENIRETLPLKIQKHKEWDRKIFGRTTTEKNLS